MNWKIERLERLAELRKKGALSQDEFESEKAKVLGGSGTFAATAIDVAHAAVVDGPAAAHTPKTAADAEPASVVQDYEAEELHTTFTEKYRVPLKWLGFAFIGMGLIFILAKFGLYIAIVIGMIAIGSHVYSNSTEDERLLRFARYGYVVAAVAFLVNLGGGRLISNENHWLMPSGTDKRSADSDGESFADSYF